MNISMKQNTIKRAQKVYVKATPHNCEVIENMI